MLDGGLTDMPELAFDTFGIGLSHMEAAGEQECPRCHNTRRVGSKRLPVPCPNCTGEEVES